MGSQLDHGIHAHRVRPDPSEHDPYYGKYVALVPEGDVFEAFETETATTLALLESVTAERSLHRYAPGKWSLRQTYVHVADGERVFAYRALRFARGDLTELPGFEPEDYVPSADADARSWLSIVDEYAAVRRSSIALFRNLPEAAWTRAGIASGSRMSVRAVAYNILGHDIHHRKLVHERYLLSKGNGPRLTTS